ncbi:MAG: DUF885 domain-containing protein [Gammaproteobacteria bacterium]|nr:DUF885 domain-containing protein [Gammaproteobacteria bacterium]MCW8988423.1 DUF885 domain-containing protein [Gammaproteobacteria bacterium]
MAKLTTIIDRYYRTWFRFHPEVAVDVGVAGYANILKPYGDDELNALKVLNEKLISSLDELDTKALSQDQQIDLQLMRSSAVLQLEAHASRDWRLTDPARFLPVHAIYQLTVRDVEDKKTAFRERLAAIPAHLRGARSWLDMEPEKIPPVWLESAIAEAKGGSEFFHDLKQHPEINGYRVSEELEQAAHALDDFVSYLKEKLAKDAKGDFSCGRSYFDLILQERHFLNINADELYNFGEKLFEETEQALKKVTQELQGNNDVNALMKKIQQQRPEKENILDEYRSQMQAARKFVEDNDIVSLPGKENLKVIETPVFLQHQIPFAAYYEPSPKDVEQQGYYYVTPAKSEEDLGEHNTVSLKHTCVHEAWPGHHLQFVKANSKPTSSTLPRLLNASATLYEGWALYCEQLMHELGFITEPESRFVLLKDRLWRALRIMIDVGIHTRGLSLEDAANLMQEKLGFSKNQAMGDLTWYTHAPGVPMAYATGWSLINKLKELQQKNEPFNLKTFHDTLLSSGSIPLPLTVVRGFGLTAWQEIHQSVFKDI